MWTAKHRSWCTDRDQYRVVEVFQQIHDARGGVLDDGHLNDQQVVAQCVGCGARAVFVAEENG